LAPARQICGSMKSLARIQWRAVSVSKQGNHAAENEDAYQPDTPPGAQTDPKNFVWALADGATQTSFSGLWARLLVRAAAGTYPDASLPDLVSAAQANWVNALSRTALPWHAEEKVRQGAFSTLAWFGLKPSSHSWKAVVIGDSCLFQVRGGKLIRMFPEYESVDFRRSPLLLSSIPARNTRILDDLTSFAIDGNWVAGDQFLLMTDALACWTVSELEKGSDPFGPLQAVILKPENPDEAFGAWLEVNRRERNIKNDDTTLLWVNVDEKQPAAIDVTGG
jgi:hypothetical protein